MARAGILYSHVAKAATALAAAGTNPTVDTVRAALGDTGSKSTIAPLLKRWKAEHESQAVAASTGLPTDLLEAVQAVHQRLEAAAQVQVEQLRAEHEQARQASAQKLEAERTAARQMRAERDAQATELAQMKAALRHEREEQQHAAVTMAALQAEQAGLTERLADRAAEIKLLADQLAHARQQFEHFQDKAAERRESDKQAADVRAAALERELAQVRGHLGDHREALATLRTEKNNLQARLDEAITVGAAHAGRASLLAEQLASANEMASAEHMNAEVAEARFKDAGQEIVQRDARIHALEQDVVRLQDSLSAAAAAKLPASGKKRG
ncbi:DNA-binding protein [Rhodoferax sp.]|uniref:DNA-binding protein n=1 Tax=Rhodoferax sp. TaxID=50421 RepID=UPI002842C210|nr:DNA-binding protein [Rhodoferax sp.]MDR3369688.1 DNA-binding protein [Rhodoferax sp.]